jgi:uncharacterized peroxidase-related enzyme
MTFFTSLPEEAGARDIFKLNREAGKAMIDYHTAILRQPSALTEGERELIAGYVSALNNCSYCAGVHSRTAEAFGLPVGLVEKMVDDLDNSGVEERLLPLLRYARKLTQTPWKMVKADAEAVFAAGWDEQALHDAINVIALYNFMNRLISGHGVEGNPTIWAERASALRQKGYSPLKETLEKE